MSKQMFDAAKPKDFLKATKLLVIALVTGVSIITIIVIILLQLILDAPLKEEVTPSVIQGLVGFAAIMAIGCMFAANSIYKRKLKVLKNTNSLTEKLNLYRVALITYEALCEGAALLSVIVLFLTGKMEVLVITVVLIIVMASKIPQPEKLINEWQLNWMELQDLDKT